MLPRQEEKLDSKNSHYNVLVTGAPGSGKSSLINYLMGCQMTYDQEAEELKVAEGEKCYAEISYTAASKKPQYQCIEDEAQKITYFDTSEISIVKSDLINKLQGTILVTVNAPLLQAERGNGMRACIKQLDALFENVNVEIHPIRFILTQHAKPKVDVSYEARVAKICAGLCTSIYTTTPISRMISDPKNWLCVGRLEDPTYKNNIIQWLNENRNAKNPSVKVPLSPHVKLNMLNEKSLPSVATTAVHDATPPPGAAPAGPRNGPPGGLSFY